MSVKATTSPSVRSPLGDSTNDLRSQTPSPVYDTARTRQSNKSIRRKVSVSTFRQYADSSDSMPSEHSSIFDAVHWEPETHEFEATQPAVSFVTGGRTSRTSVRQDAQDNPPVDITLPTVLPERSVHLPTPLDTITEQRSIATLRPLASLSKAASTQTLKANAKARHKKSFSLDDLMIPRRITRFFKSSSDENTDTSLAENKYPCQPVHAPPDRAPTPPGLPTFNTPEAASYRLPYPPLRLRTFFRIGSTQEEREYERATAELPAGAVMRGDNGVIVRGRWQATQSGHTGRAPRPGGGRRANGRNDANPISSGETVSTAAQITATSEEAFEEYMSTMATMLSRDDWDTPEQTRARATLRADYEGRVRGIRDGANASRRAGTRVEHGGGHVDEKRRFREVFGEWFCTVCCGVEKMDDPLSPRPVATNTTTMAQRERITDPGRALAEFTRATFSPVRA